MKKMMMKSKQNGSRGKITGGRDPQRSGKSSRPSRHQERITQMKGRKINTREIRFPR